MGTMYTEALTFATIKHAGQKRKYTGEDYIHHPLEVVSILESHAWGSDVVKSAAILHDVIEDTDATFDDLHRFGGYVFNLVFWLTDVSQPKWGNRATRKQIDRMHICASPYREAKIIKCADLISNTRSIVQHDPKFAKVYLEEKRNLISGLGHGDFRNESIYRTARDLVIANAGGNIDET